MPPRLNRGVPESLLSLPHSPTQPERIGQFVMRTPNLDGTWIDHDLRSIWMSRKRSHVEQLRRQHLGFALQSGELLPALTVRENIAAPLKLNGVSTRECNARVTELLQSFGLEDPTHEAGAVPTESQKKEPRRKLGDQRVNRLSGGEYQRVALARAIAHRPTLLFVDEPTSALNRELAHGALRQLRALQCGPSSHGALIMITHDENLAATFADVIVKMAPRRGEAVGELVEVITNTPSVEAEFAPTCDDPTAALQEVAE